MEADMCEKRLLSILLAMYMVVGMSSGTAWAVETVEESDTFLEVKETQCSDQPLFINGLAMCGKIIHNS